MGIPLILYLAPERYPLILVEGQKAPEIGKNKLMPRHFVLRFEPDLPPKISRDNFTKK